MEVISDMLASQQTMPAVLTARGWTERLAYDGLFYVHFNSDSSAAIEFLLL